MGFVKSDDHIVSIRDSYSWVKYLMITYLERFDVEVTYVEAKDPSDFERVARPNTKVLSLESPTSFTFKLQNLTVVSKISKTRGIKTIIDNTWCTAVYQTLIDFGFDGVVHSATKYLEGHPMVESVRYPFLSSYPHLRSRSRICAAALPSSLSRESNRTGCQFLIGICNLSPATWFIKIRSHF